MRVDRGFCKNVFDHTFGQLARALILLQDDEHGHARFDGRTGLSIHNSSIAYGRGEVAFSNFLSPRKIKHL